MFMSSNFYNESLNIRDASQQKRKQARTQSSLSGEFVLIGQNTSHPCVVTDIGTGGLSIQTKSTLYDGDQITIRIRLKGKLMSIDADVARVSGKNIGLKIRNMSEAEITSIQDFIHDNFFSKDKKKT